MTKFERWKSSSGLVETCSSDMSKALSRMEERLYSRIPAAELKVWERPDTPLGEAGREVGMSLSLNGESALGVLWSFALPHGFTPLARYPEPCPPYDEVFHFLGPWQSVYTHFTSAGRGEAAWKSTVYAARVAAGLQTPEFLPNERRVEGFVQAHLHRLGYNIGFINGKIGQSETAALRSLGLGHLPLEEAALQIASIQPPEQGTVDPPYRGNVLVKGLVRAQGFGDVQAVQTNNGAAIRVAGPGRVVLDIDPNG